MSLLSLKYFLVAAEEMNFTTAARRLYITQQTLSAHIQRLEQEYQVTLFNRRPRLSLTPEGDRMVKYATRIVRLERIMSAEFADLDPNARGILSLGISRMRAKHFFHDLWAAYRSRFPNMEIYLSEGSADTLIRLVTSHKIDMCIGIEIQPGLSLCLKPLMTEELFVAIPKKLFYNYYNYRAEEMVRIFSHGVSFHQLPSFPLLLLSPANRIRRIVDHQFDAIDQITRPVFESNDQELLIGMCEKGEGQAFLPATSLFLTPDKNLNIEHIFAFPLQDIQIETALGYPSDLELPHYAQAFIHICQEVFQKADEQIKRESTKYLEDLRSNKQPK